MSDALSFAEIQRQHAELLPARTVMSLLHTELGLYSTATAHLLRGLALACG